MKILHVVPWFYPAHVYGGPIETVFQYCRWLTSMGECDVRVLTTNANGADTVLTVDTSRDIEFPEGFQVRYCHRVSRTSVSIEYLARVLSYVRWADLVHITAVYSFPTLPTLLACKLLSKPVVLSPRGAFRRFEHSTRIAAKNLYEQLARLVSPKQLILHATSDEEAQDTQKRKIGFNVVTIPNGIQIPDEISPIKQNGVLRLLYIGRLHPIKGIENLVEACSQLSGRTDRAWKLTLAGTGDQRYVTSLRALIENRELSDRVDLAGQVVGNAKRALFENADFVVAPSYRESFGMSIIEALAHGVPVIAGKGTPWKRLESMQCGLWVENDPENLAKAIERMSRMPLAEMGQRGRTWVQDEFQWPFIAQRMASVYRQLLDRNA